MFCPNCGKELKDTSKFCTGCGAAIKRPPVIAQEVAPVEPPVPVVPQLPVEEPIKPVVEQKNPDIKPETIEESTLEIIDADDENADDEAAVEPDSCAEYKPEKNTVPSNEHLEIAEETEDDWFKEKKEKKQAFVDISGNSATQKALVEKAKKGSNKKKVRKESANSESSKKGVVGIVISIIAILLVACIIIAAVLISENVFVPVQPDEYYDEYEEFDPFTYFGSCEYYDESFDELLVSYIDGEDVVLPYAQEILEYSYIVDGNYLQHCFVPEPAETQLYFDEVLENLWVTYMGTGYFISEEAEKIRECISSVFSEYSESIEIYDIAVNEVSLDDSMEDDVHLGEYYFVSVNTDLGMYILGVW